jgi:hypothetical protein
MGTTRPPFSQPIAQERRRWAPLRRALSNEDRAAFEKSHITELMPWALSRYAEGVRPSARALPWRQ